MGMVKRYLEDLSVEMTVSDVVRTFQEMARKGLGEA